MERQRETSKVLGSTVLRKGLHKKQTSEMGDSIQGSVSPNAYKRHKRFVSSMYSGTTRT